MDLFIDTNIFLSFYHFSGDDLEKLDELAVLVRRQDITLQLPQQVVVELKRNRASKLAQALEGLRRQHLNLQFPQLCKEYEEYQTLRDYQRRYEERHTALLGRIGEDIHEHTLRADVTLADLFALGCTLATSPEIVDRARLRCELGNPPGKRGSLGDAISWECLLEGIPAGHELNFISDDTDFCSALDSKAFDPFLLDEWAENKGSDLFFYKTLSSFFRREFPNISLADEMEKDTLIGQLAESSSFAQTHYVIGQLFRYSDFTHAQINDIVTAVISNNQVYWIIGDPDVGTYVRSVIDGHEDQIEPSNLSGLYDFLRDAEGQDEIPF